MQLGYIIKWMLNDVDKRDPFTFLDFLCYIEFFLEKCIDSFAWIMLLDYNGEKVFFWAL